MHTFAELMSWDLIAKIAVLGAMAAAFKPAVNYLDALTKKAIEEDTKDWRRGL